MQDRTTKALLAKALLASVVVAFCGLVLKDLTAPPPAAYAGSTTPMGTSDASIAVTNNDHVYVIQGGKIVVYDYSGLFINVGQPAKNRDTSERGTSNRGHRIRCHLKLHVGCRVVGVGGRDTCS